jgi:hypothetical protein
MTVAELIEPESHKIYEILEIFSQHAKDKQVFIQIGRKKACINQISVNRFTGNITLSDK